MPFLMKDNIVGNAVEIHVNSAGSFVVYIEGTVGPGGMLGSGDTLEKAKVNARVALVKHKVRVKVPFKTGNGKSAVATGFHSRNQTIMTTVNGKSEQFEFDKYRSDTYSPETPQEVFDRLREINDITAKLRAERVKIDNKWGLRLSTAVQDAINKAAAEKASESS